MSPTKVSKYAWFNGAITDREKAAPSVASISFHLGTGVFDGIIAYWNRSEYYLHCLEAHLVRFRAGAARMGLEFPWTVAELTSGILQLLDVGPKTTQYIRPIAYRKPPELWITGSEGLPVDICIFTVKVARDEERPITCHISPVERISSRCIPQQIKVSGAYVNSFAARKAAEVAGFDDGIMLDRRGYITEASAANFFGIRGETLLTPTLTSDVFPGITRQVVLNLAANLGIGCVETDLKPDALNSLDGAFLCSTLMELRGVSKLGDITLRTADNGLYRKMIEAFRDVTHQSGHPTRVCREGRSDTHT